MGVRGATKRKTLVKVLVVGSGAREHAILWKLRQSPQVSHLYAVPGNAGMEAIATCINPSGAGNLLKPEDYADLAAKLAVDLTIIGPEGLLIDGVADHFIARDGTVTLSKTSPPASHTNLMSHTRPGHSRDRIAENPGPIA
jgi:phosphoribosylamine-glycine ligase